MNAQPVNGRSTVRRSKEGRTVNPRAMECSTCGARYDETSWVQLPLAARVDAGKVRSFVLGWPEDQFIQVRACRCGRLIAARWNAARASRTP
jgi:hypothetical protein